MDDPSLPTRLDDIPPWIDRALSRGVADPKSAFRWPTLLSTDLEGRAQARTVVLRGFDPSTHEISIFTDLRSPKVSHLRKDTRAGLHIYDNKKRVQLRLEAEAIVVTTGEAWEAGWARAQQGSLIDYQRMPGPGALIDEPQGADQDVGGAQKNFALVILTVQKADYLHLGREQHRRAVVHFGVEGSRATWIVP